MSKARDGFAAYASGIDQALSTGREHLVGNNLTLADICFAAELSLFFNENARRASELEEKGLEPIIRSGIGAQYPRAFAHFARLREHPAFIPDLTPYLKTFEPALSAYIAAGQEQTRK